MSPGRQKVSDDDVFAAAQRAMTRQGPHELTLADIAAEAGVSAGRLVQRFGSKRALLLALAERFAGSAAAVFAGLRAAHRQPLATLRAYAACMADLAVTPEALSRNLAYLQIDLTDPEFRAHLLANARATRREIEALLRAAFAAGELKQDVDVPPSRPDRRDGDRRIAHDVGVLSGRTGGHLDAARPRCRAAGVRDASPPVAAVRVPPPASHG